MLRGQRRDKRKLKHLESLTYVCREVLEAFTDLEREEALMSMSEIEKPARIPTPRVRQTCRG